MKNIIYTPINLKLDASSKIDTSNIVYTPLSLPEDSDTHSSLSFDNGETFYSNDLPDYTPRGYKKQYTSHEVRDEEDVVLDTVEDSNDSDPELSSNDSSEDFHGDRYLRFKTAYDLSGVRSDRFNFFTKLAAMESGFNPSIQNSAGYPAWGYFQFMDGTYTSSDGRVRQWNNIRDIAGVDVSTFISNPILQIQSADKLANRFLKGFNRRDFAKARELGYTDSALVAGAWLAGVGGVQKFLHEGKNSSDVHGTNVGQRMRLFNNYFKRGGVLKFNSGGFVDYVTKNRDHINKLVADRSFLPVGNLASNDSLHYYKLHPDDRSAYVAKIFPNVRKYLESRVSKDKLTDDILYAIVKDFEDYDIKGSDFITRRSIMDDVKVNKKSSYWDTLDYNEVYSILDGLFGHSVPRARLGMKIRRYDGGGDIHKQVFDWASDQNGKMRYEMSKGNKNFPLFYQLLRDPNRPVLDLGNGYSGTHKLSYVSQDDKWYIYPTIQWSKDENGEWVGTDYDQYEDWRIGWENAYNNGDYLEIPSEEMAKYFTENYKKAFSQWYPGFEEKEEVTIPESMVYSIGSHPEYSWHPPMEIPSKIKFTPTISDLAKQLTMAYETFQSKPYILETEKEDGTIQRQELIGHGLADKALINKYRQSGIPRDVSERLVISTLQGLHDRFLQMQPNYKNLPLNIQLAILDTAYNTSGDSFWANSPKFTEMVQNGITDPEILVTELDHSKNAKGWLGDRSAARRALAVGKYKWNYPHIDIYGRHYDPSKPLSSRDYERALYLNNY